LLRYKKLHLIKKKKKDEESVKTKRRVQNRIQRQPQQMLKENMW